MVRQQRQRWSAAPRYPRTARVNEVLREIIAEQLEREYDEDSRLELVTVTGVETVSDLAHATVYFSALGTDASLDEVIKALEERRIQMQAAIGKSVRMKRTPHLRFVPDPGIIAGQKMEGIIRDLPPPAPDLPDDEDGE